MEIRDSHVELDFAGERRLFKLCMGEIRALETACDTGIYWLFQLVETKKIKTDELRQILYQGLCGGGLKIHEAETALKVHFDDKPKMQFYGLAKVVLGAALMGVPREKDEDAEETPDAKKKSPVANKTGKKPSRRASPGRKSTGTRQKSGSRQGKSTNSQSSSGSVSSKPISQKTETK